MTTCENKNHISTSQWELRGLSHLTLISWISGTNLRIRGLVSEAPLTGFLASAACGVSGLGLTARERGVGGLKKQDMYEAQQQSSCVWSQSMWSNTFTTTVSALRLFVCNFHIHSLDQLKLMSLWCHDSASNMDVASKKLLKAEHLTHN